MRINQDQLIDELLRMTDQSYKTAVKFRELSIEKLNYKPDETKWSILECIEHLNLYGDFYLPEIEQKMMDSELKDVSDDHPYKSSWIGDYFVKAVRADNKKKMTATKMMTPKQSDFTMVTLDRFIKQLEWLTLLMNQAKNKNLRKIKTTISLTTLFTLRLGDTLRFLVYHNERHILQAERILKIHD